MKKWLISLGLSVVLCGIGLGYFLCFIAQDTCLDSGGRWLGIMAGCEGGRELELDIFNIATANLHISGHYAGCM